MGDVQGGESAPDARELVRQRLRVQIPDRRSDHSVVDQLLADRKADLVLEDTRWRERPQA
jgi:hypothetical protein